MDEIPVLRVSFEQNEALYLAYMPYIQGGGLFIRSQILYPMGTSISLSLRLPNDAKIYLVKAKVVWITPIGAQDNKQAGIGVSFVDDIAGIRQKIEDILVDSTPYLTTDTL